MNTQTIFRHSRMTMLGAAAMLAWLPLALTGCGAGQSNNVPGSTGTINTPNPLVVSGTVTSTTLNTTTTTNGVTTTTATTVAPYTLVGVTVELINGSQTFTFPATGSTGTFSSSNVPAAFASGTTTLEVLSGSTVLQTQTVTISATSGATGLSVSVPNPPAQPGNLNTYPGSL